MGKKITNKNMIAKFIYRNKKTGQRLYSNEELHLKDFNLEMEVKNTQMRSRKINKKSALKNNKK